MHIEQLIEICTQFAVKKGLCFEQDKYLVRNKLMTIFNTFNVWEGEVEVPESIIPVLEQMTDIANEMGLLEMNTKTFRDMFDTKICACMLMMQSQAEQEFKKRLTISAKEATDWFYAFCCDSNYIRTHDIAKNIKYDFASEYADFEVTINLTKPEKDPVELERQRRMPQTNYPKCMLCIENVGYPGRLGYPSHETLRVIPITLGGDTWYFQYSPYVYYNEHCIVFQKNHSPMTMDRNKFIRLFDFLDQFPHYFIGSNTQLPIVGGSILAHEHFQGGKHVMPMDNAKEKFSFDCGNTEVSACIINWPMSTIRLKSKSRELLTDLGEHIYNVWRNYNDSECNIVSFSDGEEHNTITPISRLNSLGEYELDVVLRNNLTSDDLPLGIYHPHPDKHHIKRENIGLIEVMGLFILPGRLKTELDYIAQTWADKKDLEKDNIHFEWFESFKNNITPSTKKEALEYIYQQVGFVCENVLRDAGVYKEDACGQEGLKRFLLACGFKL